MRMATNKSCCVPHTTQPTTRRCARTNPIEAIMPTPYGHLTPPNPTHHNYKAKALSGGSDDASSSTVHAQRRDQLPGSVVRQEGRRGCSRLAVISSLLCTLSRLHSSFCTHTSITLVQSVLLAVPRVAQRKGLLVLSRRLCGVLVRIPLRVGCPISQCLPSKGSARPQPSDTTCLVAWRGDHNHCPFTSNPSAWFAATQPRLFSNQLTVYT